MSTFGDAIAAVLSTVSAGPTPLAPSIGDFGSDLSCTDDITADARELAANDPQLVAERFYRWLLTEPGTLPDLDNKDWGGGLRGMLRKAMTPSGLVSIPSRLRSKWLADDDETTESMTISPLVDVGGHVYQFDVSAITAVGPFSLTLAATSADIVIKAMVTP